MGIRTSIFDWEKWWISSITERGHCVVTSGFNAEKPNVGPHRPTVYLDQNKWSLVAAALLSPETVKPESELEAAIELVRLATDDGVILPLSSAHLTETSALHTDLRYEVGVALAGLSSGWQMRHPLDVLEQEAMDGLRSTVLGTEPAPFRPIVTTEPGAWMHKSSPFGIGLAREPSAEFFLYMISSAGALVALLINPEPIKPTAQSRWVDRQRSITDQFRSLNLRKEQKRNVARRRYWNEQISTYRVAANLLGLAEIPSMSDRDLKRMLALGPMTHLLSELFATRFVDSSTRWHANDLLDMFFLSCGSAYCDYVVGERKTVSQLTQIRRARGEETRAFRTLADLVDALHKAGVTTDSERRGSDEAGTTGVKGGAY